jgi:hypothetical protein
MERKGPPLEAAILNGIRVLNPCIELPFDPLRATLTLLEEVYGL